jgi:hypothetical protein
MMADTSTLSVVERRRLSLSEPDWNNLTTTGTCMTRTRGNGRGRPDLQKAQRNKEAVIDLSVPDPVDAVLVNEEEATIEEAGAPLLDSSEAVVAKKPAKPIHHRVLLEVGQLESALKFYKCPDCNDPFELKQAPECVSRYTHQPPLQQQSLWVCASCRPASPNNNA